MFRGSGRSHTHRPWTHSLHAMSLFFLLLVSSPYLFWAGDPASDLVNTLPSQKETCHGPHPAGARKGGSLCFLSSSNFISQGTSGNICNVFGCHTGGDGEPRPSMLLTGDNAQDSPTVKERVHTGEADWLDTLSAMEMCS